MPVTINGTTGIAGPDGSASTPAVQGTDSNTGLFYPAADTVALSTGGTERMRIDSSGNVLVGKTSLSDSTVGIQLRTQGVYVVGCTSSGSEALMLNRNTSDGTIASIKRGNTEVGTISVTGSATAYNTASPSTDGAQLNYQGITFRATQSASSDANTLDDYEEGTWTPNVGGTATYTTQTASYTKIGNTVVVWGEITINLIGTGSTTRVYGLPFTSNGSYVQPGSTGYFANLAQSVYSMTTAVEPGTTNLVFHTQTSLSGTNNINQAVLGNSARIQFSVTYKV